MKKLLSVLLCGVIILSFAGCLNNTEGQNSASNVTCLCLILLFIAVNYSNTICTKSIILFYTERNLTYSFLCLIYLGTISITSQQVWHVLNTYQKITTLKVCINSCFYQKFMRVTVSLHSPQSMMLLYLQNLHFYR